ncbi:MAG: hypothetical protein QW727_00185 [Candidatus Pacearchaeota archaeon]
MISRRDFILRSMSLLATILKQNISYGNQTSEERRNELLDLHKTRKPKKINNRMKVINDGKETYEIITFPSLVNLPEIPPHPINLEVYCNYDKENPIIMIPSMLGGISKIERKIGRYFSNERFKSVIVGIPVDYNEIILSGIRNIKSEGDVNKFIENFNKGYEQLILDNLQVLDWIEENSDNRKGIFGLSFGGIISASVMGIDERLDSAVLLLTGGNLHKIIAYSNQPEISKIRKYVLEKLGKDQIWLEKELGGRIKLDPMNLTEYIRDEKIMLVTAGNDGVIPTCKELEERLPDSEKIHLNGLGHESSVIAWPIVRNGCAEFLRKNLY